MPFQDPCLQFEAWYQAALTVGENDIDAMSLATASASGRPSVRTVLYKGIDQGGFLIFTNLKSRKASELFENPQAALCFYWPKSYRQVRVEGTMRPVSPEESAQYFKTRSRESCLSAWASRQSQPIASRDILIERYNAADLAFKEPLVPCPPFWGGFRLIPTVWEFWSGCDHRLHDRLVYTLSDEQQWVQEILSP